MLLKKDKYIILYLGILLVLTVYRLLNPLQDSIDAYLPLLALFMVWDVYLRPRKYKATFTYLNSLDDDYHLIYLFHCNKMKLVDRVYVKIDTTTENPFDGFRELPSSIGFPLNQLTEIEMRDIANVCPTVSTLLAYMHNNMNRYPNKTNYRIERENDQALTWGTFSVYVMAVFIYGLLLHNFWF